MVGGRSFSTIIENPPYALLVSELPSALRAALASRATFIAALEAVNPDLLSRQPAPEAWSPLQIAEHVVLVEEQMVGFATRQAAAGPQRREVGGPDDAMRNRVLHAIRSGTRLRIPDGVRVHPRSDPRLDDVATRWRASGEQMRALVETFPPDLESTALLVHPAAGPLTLEQSLVFIDEHARHHLHQLARTVDVLTASPAIP
jgi:hypothetical protein